MSVKAIAAIMTNPCDSAIFVFHSVGMALKPQNHATTACPNSCTGMPKAIACALLPMPVEYTSSAKISMPGMTAMQRFRSNPRSWPATQQAFSKSKSRYCYLHFPGQVLIQWCLAFSYAETTATVFLFLVDSALTESAPHLEQPSPVPFGSLHQALTETFSSQERKSWRFLEHWQKASAE